MVDIEQLREAVNYNPRNASNAPLMWPLDVLLAAASELLALKENGQTVWWCVEHESVSNADQSLGEGAVRMCHAAIAWDEDTPCREVKGSLHIHREGT